MNIGIIAHDAHPICEPFQGGLEMITHLLVNELVDRGHNVTTLCLLGSQLSGRMVHYSSLTHNDNKQGQSSELLDFGRFYKSAIDFLDFDFDVIHNNSLNHHAIILGSLYPIPFITSFHTPVFKNLNVAIQAVQKNPNQVFTAVSNSLQSIYNKHLPHIKTVYNGIDINSWSVSDAKQNYYSWCGRICKEKGLWEIMDLCEQNAIQLKFAGPISDSKYFNDYIKPRLNTYNKCEYLGHLNQSEINGLLSNSKGFIFSSTWQEPYGLVIAEALASGIPVLANDIGAAKEIIEYQSGVLFSLDNPETFKLALAEISKLKSEDCRTRAEEFCSHHKMVSSYEELYSLVSRSKAVQL